MNKLVINHSLNQNLLRNRNPTFQPLVYLWRRCYKKASECLNLRCLFREKERLINKILQLNKPVFIAFLILLASQSVKAQENLVYNGDFELYDTCPEFNDQVSRCIGWSKPTYGSSDYFNACSGNNTEAGVPNNSFGYQLPQSGAGYAGFIVDTDPKNSVIGCDTSQFYYEYLQGKLTLNLISNHVYEVSFNVSLANSSNRAIDLLGCHFSNNQIYQCNSDPLNLTKHVSSNLGFFYNDTINWVEVKGFYTAFGGENTIIIGRFNALSIIDTQIIIDNNVDPFAYYYVDDFSVVDITSKLNLLIPNCITPNNDGVNDSWSIPLLDEADGFIILNRWGQKVFVGNSKTDWRGLDSNGNSLNEGVYFFRTTGKTEKAGFIQLFR